MKKILLLLLLAANVTHAQFIGAPRRGLSGSGGGGGSETDPVFSASPAAGITSPNITNWLSAYSWGNHASAGYQITSNLSTDLIASASKYPNVNAVNTGLGLKANLAGGATFTGTIAMPSTFSVGTVSATEISYLDGVTTSIQPNIDSRAPNNLNGYVSGAGTVASTDNILQAIQKLNGNDGLKANLAGPTFTGTVTLPSTTSIGTITSTELGYVDGLSSSVQTQIDSKAPLASPTFTGTPTLPTGTIATTQSAGNNTTAVATTAFVTTADNLKANLAGPTFTGTVVLPSTTSIGTITNTELGYVDGVTGSIQTQIDSKAAIASPSFTGNAAVAGNVTVSTIPAMSTKPSGVLVSDGGVISTRTNAQHYADITEIQNFKRVASWEAQGNGSTVNALGLAFSAQGTATPRAVATTNFYTGIRRIGYVGATTANSLAGLSGNNAQFQVARGFAYRAVFGIQAYDAGHRYFVGMGETTDNAVDPSALVNRLNMYADPGDVTWKIRGANASQGTAVDLGANFPVNTSATDMYDVTFICEPGATTATYLVRRLNTGDTASGTISTVPGAALIRPQVIAGNAATGTAASIDIARVVVITEN